MGLPADGRDGGLRLRRQCHGAPHAAVRPAVLCERAAFHGARRALQKAVYEAFARLGIPFTRVDTDPGITMEDCLHIAGKIGVHIVKTVFVCNRQQTEFYLYVMPDDKPFVTREFCAALGIPRVSFASAEKLRELTGVAVGATTILSAILPEAAGVHLVIDRAIADSPWIACTDGTPTCFIKLPTRALLDTYLPACNHTYTII